MKRDKSLFIRLTEDELEQIEKNAEACGKTVSAYVREISRNMCILTVEHACVTEHTAQLSSYRNAVAQLIFTLIKRKDYNLVDIEYIANKTNEMLACEKAFLKDHLRAVEENQKLIERTVRDAVDKNMKRHRIVDK